MSVAYEGIGKKYAEQCLIGQIYEPENIYKKTKIWTQFDKLTSKVVQINT